MYAWSQGDGGVRRPALAETRSAVAMNAGAATASQTRLNQILDRSGTIQYFDSV